MGKKQGGNYTKEMELKTWKMCLDFWVSLQKRENSL